MAVNFESQKKLYIINMFNIYSLAMIIRGGKNSFADNATAAVPAMRAASTFAAAVAT